MEIEKKEKEDMSIKNKIMVEIVINGIMDYVKCD
jgi:hypothetical protein